MRFELKVSTIVLVVLVGTSHGCSEHERNALLQLFSYFNIDSSFIARTPNCCDWRCDVDSAMNNPNASCSSMFEIQCNDAEGRVTELAFQPSSRRKGDLYLNTSLFLPFKGLRNLKLFDPRIVGCAENEGFQRLSRLENLESLDLSFNSFNNSIFSSQGLCELRHMRYLTLYHNDLSGSLPWCLANMTSLQELDLSSNQISGEIGFSPIKSLTSLEKLEVGGNRFKVPISLAPFFNHSKLKWLDVAENELYAQTEFKNLLPKFQLETLYMSSPVRNANAAYPAFLYHQHSLQDVELSRFQIMGEFPYWLLENNTDLEALDLSNNFLSGTLQLPIHLHMSLSTLDIFNNSIHGHIPSEFGAHFPRLSHLNMSTNALIGSIPDSLSHLSNLSVLDISHNNLSGNIPDSLFHLSDLGVLDISHNNLSGNIPDSFSHLSNLRVLDISHNNLSGSIPSWICSFPSFNYLDLSENSLSGALPTDFCSPSTSQLKLSNNKLFGSLTGVLFYCPMLITLDLGYNRFTGSIPDWIRGCSQLKFLLLSHNNLQGKIPDQFCVLDQLNLIDLSHNNLSGHILPCLMSRRNWNIQTENESSLDDDNQPELQFTEKNRSPIYQASILKYLSGIDLSCNNLTGEIPPEIGNLSEIHVLNLSHNSLMGQIPLMFVNLKQIESLDLSYNKLYGKIPSQLTELNFLSVFSVAYNNLSGKIPDRVGQFGTFEESSYEGNPLLCGMPLPKKYCERMPRTSTEEESEEDNGFMDMEAFYVSFLVSYIMVLLVIAAVLYINPYWRRLLFAFIDATTTKFYYFLLDNLPLLSKFWLS